MTLLEYSPQEVSRRNNVFTTVGYTSGKSHFRRLINHQLLNYDGKVLLNLLVDRIQAISAFLEQMMKRFVFVSIFSISLLYILFILNQPRVSATSSPSWIRMDGFDLNAVTYGGNIYVAVGAKGIIQTSNDGKTWVKRKTVLSADLAGVVWNGKRFVAVGDHGTIITSNDGQSWKKVTFGFRNSLKDIVWGLNRFVAVGDHGAIFVSMEGRVWRQAFSGTGAALNGVGVNDHLFIAVGAGATILTSSDGARWSPVEYPQKKEGWDYFLEKVKWLEQQFVIVGGVIGTKPSLPIMLKSSDAIQWEEKIYDTVGPELIGEGRFLNIAQDVTQYIAVGDQGRVYSIPDCSQCARLKTESEGDLRGILWDGKQFLIVGKGVILRSAPPAVELFVNGEFINLEAPPLLEKNDFLVPYPKFIAALGAAAVLDESAGRITITKANTSIVLKTSFSSASVNGVLRQIEVTPRVINNQVYIPVRPVAACFGYRVDWDAVGKQIIMESVFERFSGKDQK